MSLDLSQKKISSVVDGDHRVRLVPQAPSSLSEDQIKEGLSMVIVTHCTQESRSLKKVK